MCALRSLPAETAASRGTVLFVHGLWMTGAESLLLGRRLRRAGWGWQVFAYSSRREPVDVVAWRLADTASELGRRSGAPVHLVAHSLGGIITCRMFDMGLVQAPASADLQRVVLLGSPLNGTAAGRALAAFGAPGRALLGKAGREGLLGAPRAPDDPYRWRHAVQLGVVAGDGGRGFGRMIARMAGPGDGTVTVAETCVEGATASCVLPVGHMGLLVSRRVAAQVGLFLAHGRFDVAASVAPP